MKRRLTLLKKMKISDVIDAFIFSLLYPVAMVMRLFMKEVWLISERPGQARDNGYHFYKYLRTAHLEINAYYIIKKESADFFKIERFDNIIQFRSLKHFLYYMVARIHCSSQIGGGMPNPALCNRMKRCLHAIFVYLKHGITINKAPFCYKMHSNVDLFICGAKPEYDFATSELGYSKDEAVYTGFSRFDNLHDFTTDKTKILLMPTWRIYLSHDDKADFLNSKYYKSYSSLLNDTRLIDYLEKNNLVLQFYLHHEMRPFEKYFKSSSSSIHVLSDESENDIQELLKTCSLFITDYTSAQFDCAYMRKSIIYFQFDFDEFTANHYQRGYFDYYAHGFGPVTNNVNQAVDQIIKIHLKKFVLEESYEKRVKEFFVLHDKHNSERIFLSILRSKRQSVLKVSESEKRY